MAAVEPTTEATANRSRRDVLCGLVVALVAPGALVACSDNSSSDGGTSGGGGGSAGTGGGTSGGGTKLAALTDVPQGSGLVVNKPGGGKIVLVRSGDGVKAFNAACKHQGVTVSPPQGGTITCPAHGSQYDAATGALKKGPAKAGLDEVQVKVQGSDVVLA